ncbi:MAG: PD40 domain-containing protein, partial [Anaerolineales bacterium]|nr:PD40 domain-containing protein [Anaerolineales bacterium]
LEPALRAVLQTPPLRPEFAAALSQRLQAAAHARATHTTPAPRWRPGRRLALAGLVLAAVLALTLALGPQRVLAQVLGWFGYVPGTGYVETEQGLRVLANPHTVEQDGIRVSTVDGLVDDQQTVLTILFEGIRQEQKPITEDVPGCFANPQIQLPDGRRLEVLGGGGGGGHSWMQLQLSYPAIPADVNEATLLVPCVPEVLPGLGPENMSMPLQFAPAPEGFETLPVQPLVQASEPAAAPHGFALQVEDYVALEDGYLIRGQLSWQDSEFTAPEFWSIGLTLLDAQGKLIPTEFEEFPNPPSDPAQRFLTWTLRTNTQEISSPARVVLEDLSVRVTQSIETAAEISIDLGPSPSHGQQWPLGTSLPLGTDSVQVESVALVARADGSYALETRMHFDPAAITYITLLDKDNHSRSIGLYGGPAEPGILLQGLIYDELPRGIHRFWVDNYFVRLAGPWQAELTLPAPRAAATVVPAGAVCLRAEDAQPANAPLPPQLSGRVIVQDFSAGGMLPGLYLISLDGADRQFIDIGSSPALSPDGNQVAYAHDGLRLYDVPSGEMRTLIQEDSAYSMAWSPDGTQLAFVRSGQGVFRIGADGSGLQAIPGSSSDMTAIAGWLPDGKHIVVSRSVPGGAQVQTLNVITGELSDQAEISNRKGGFVTLSPDGRQITFAQTVFGGFQYSVFAAPLDGSQPRLVAESSTELMYAAGAWLGQDWLIVNVFDPNSGYTPALLLNLATCESFALPLPAVQVMAGRAD